MSSFIFTELQPGFGVSKKNEFINGELWTLAWAASVQHASVYKQGIIYDSRGVREFRRGVASYVRTQLLPLYKSGCEEPLHYRHIEDLIAHANRLGGDVLPDYGYKFGIAQKLLNLCLKYHWCLGRIKEPPHCPVDRIVIHKTKFRDKLKWTEITRPEEYRNVMAEIDKLAKKDGLSIAMWELQIYARR